MKIHSLPKYRTSNQLKKSVYLCSNCNAPTFDGTSHQINVDNPLSVFIFCPKCNSQYLRGGLIDKGIKKEPEQNKLF